MSTMTHTPLAGASGPDDFDQWEAELSPTYRPTKAAERRSAQEHIERAQGFRRHRTSEREI